MNNQEYFRQTETAVKQLFIARKYYMEQLKGTIPPIFISGESDEVKRERDFRDWLEKNKKSIDDASCQQEKYFGLRLSNTIICGSILQIAFMGIKSLSTNSDIPTKVKHLFNNCRIQRKFCVGREVRGVPIGLIIYAARNQYNHMDESLRNRLAISVFDILAGNQIEDNYKDPAFNLTNSWLKNNYAHNIIALLEWNDYDTYIKDMKEMLEK